MKRQNVSKPEARLVKMTREKVLRRKRAQYERCATKKEKTRVLDAYCTATGMRRKHAIVRLRGGCGLRKCGARGRPPVYSNALNEPLQLIWRAASYCCTELLHRHIAVVLAQLTTYGHLELAAHTRALLLRMSYATLKRRLRSLGCGKRRAYHAPRDRAVAALVLLSCTLPKILRHRHI